LLINVLGDIKLPKNNSGSIRKNCAIKVHFGSRRWARPKLRSKRIRGREFVDFLIYSKTKTGKTRLHKFSGKCFDNGKFEISAQFNFEANLCASDINFLRIED